MGLLETLLTVDSRKLKPPFIIFSFFSDTALHVSKMMLFLQEGFLLFIACNFAGIDCGPPKETTGKFLLFRL